MSTLFRVMFHCARYGRRVREQILAFGIYPDIDRNSDTCRANKVYQGTHIPEEGLLLYPVAVRAPNGHKMSLDQDVKLRASLLSHPIAPNTVMSLPVCFHITMRNSLKSIWKEGLIPGGLDGNTRIFTFFNPYVPWDQRSWNVTKSVDTRQGGYVCLYIPTETLMRDLGGRLTESGQIVTDQIVPFSKIRGGWIQDSTCRWQRLIVPSGEEQVVRIGSTKSKKIATKESVIRIAKQCVNSIGQPYDETTMEAMTILGRFEQRLIVDGGREQYDARVKLIDFILEKKAVSEAGCRLCPHCLTETPMKFSMCVEYWTVLESHGIRPYRLDDPVDEEDEDEATKRQIDEEIRKTKETLFKETVNEAQNDAENKNEYDFDMSEVDYGEGEDEEMKEEEEDVEVEPDEQEDEHDAHQEAADKEFQEKTDKLPAWAMNLEAGSKKMPVKGLVNIDVSEPAAQLFDNAVVSKILQLYKHYYDQRVMMTPEAYYTKMVANQIGRLDLDGICPYCGEDRDGVLKPPSEAELNNWYDLKATKTPWSGKEKLFGGRPRNMMRHVTTTLEVYEKMMEFLVQAGYTPERMQFLVPMNKMYGNYIEKEEMRKKISDFVSRLLKGAFPTFEHYAYFRSGNHGFPNCQEIPAFTVYLAFRESQRSEELLIAAQQCGVVLPELFVSKMAYSMTFAEKEAQRGKLNWKQHIAPNLDPSVTEAVYKTIGNTEGAQRAEEAARGESKPATPEGYPPKAKSEAASSSSAIPIPTSTSSVSIPKPRITAKSMPAKAAPKPSRPPPSDKPQQTPQRKKKRTDE